MNEPSATRHVIGNARPESPLQQVNIVHDHPLDNLGELDFGLPVPSGVRRVEDHPERSPLLTRGINSQIPLLCESMCTDDQRLILRTINIDTPLDRPHPGGGQADIDGPFPARLGGLRAVEGIARVPPGSIGGVGRQPTPQEFQ